MKIGNSTVVHKVWSGIVILLTVLATTAKAQVFVASWLQDLNAGIIGAYTTSGQTISTSLISEYSGTLRVKAMALDGNGNLLMADSYHRIRKYTTSGQVVNLTFISGVYAALAMTIDRNGHVFIADMGTGGVGTGAIREYDVNTGAAVNASFISGLTYPYGLTFDEGGHLLVLDGNAGTVRQYTSSGQLLNASFISGLYLPSHIEADGGGHLLIQDGWGAIKKYSTSGALLNGNLLPTGTTCSAFTLDGNGHVFVQNSKTTVGEYDITSGVAINSSLITVYSPNPLFSNYQITALAVLPPAPPPPLAVTGAQRTGQTNVVTLSWTNNGSSCLVECTARLTGNWGVVSSPRTTNANRVFTIVTNLAPAQFFRLRSN